MRAENAREMTLIAESAVQRDFGDGNVSRNEFLARLLNPEALDIFAKRLSVEPSKDTHQMNRMNTGNLRDLPKGHGISEVSVEERHDLLHPREVHCVLPSLLRFSTWGGRPPDS